MFLAWLGLPKFGLKFQGNIIVGFVAGSKDEVATWTDNQIAIASSAREGVEDCLPVSQHLEEEGYSLAMEHLRNGECSKGSEMLEAVKKDTAIPFCVTAIKTAYTLVCNGAPEILKNALPTTYY